MQNSKLTAAAAQLAALVSLTTRLNAEDPASHALILSDAINAQGGQVETLPEDLSGIYEFSLHGLTGNGLDPDAAAQNWLTGATEALSGRNPGWAEKIARCPVPGIPVSALQQAAQTVLAESTDPQARHAAGLIRDAARQNLFPRLVA